MIQPVSAYSLVLLLSITLNIKRDADKAFKHGTVCAILDEYVVIYHISQSTEKMFMEEMARQECVYFIYQVNYTPDNSNIAMKQSHSFI